MRPLGRRTFNTAHELGHHVLGHPGMRLDEQIGEGKSDPASSPEEFAANAFAGFLLMPKIGVRRAFTARRLESVDRTARGGIRGRLPLRGRIPDLGQSSRLQFEGDHPRTGRGVLSKVGLPVIRRSLLGGQGSDRLWVADRHYSMPTLDTEVGTTLLLPAGSEPEFDHLRHDADIPLGRVFTPTRPGLIRVEAADGWAVVVRVAKYQYSGWSTNRHLELEDGDDD